MARHGLSDTSLSCKKDFYILLTNISDSKLEGRNLWCTSVKSNKNFAQCIAVMSYIFFGFSLLIQWNLKQFWHAQDYVVSSLVVQYRLVKGRYERDHNKLEVQQVSRWILGRYLDNLYLEA